MANPEHLAVLKQGVAAWNEWRWSNSESEFTSPDVKPDLDILWDILWPLRNFSGADKPNLRRADKPNLRRADKPDLSGANLHGMTLSRVDFHEVDLRGADLSKADLCEANLCEADLCGVDLRGADLYKANLHRVDLGRADLREARLRRANLSGATLHGANLREAELRGANLYGADLSGANLHEADLREVDLREADLHEVALRQVKLGRANLRGADLCRAHLHGAILRDVVFQKVILGDTTFLDVNLADVKDLDTCSHEGPSTLDFRTLQRSSPLSPSFLQKCGLPEMLINSLPSLLSQPIQFDSCFISYSSKDEDFARRLYADLQFNEVRCWFASKDIQGGRKIDEQIGKAIKLHKKLLLVLSKHSMESEWVKTEIAEARQREVREECQVLFPISLVAYENIKQWKCFDADTGKDSAREIREYYIPDFSNWKSHDAYQQAFNRLLRDLKLALELKPES